MTGFKVETNIEKYLRKYFLDDFLEDRNKKQTKCFWGLQLK